MKNEYPAKNHFLTPKKKKGLARNALTCPLCQAVFDEEIISVVLNEEEYKKYRKLSKRTKCEVCLLNKARENIRKFDNDEHRICKDCLWGYLKALMEENDDIPEKFLP